MWNFKWATTDAAAVQQVYASGEAYDIGFACNWFADYVGSSQKKFFLDLTDLLPKEAPTLYKTLPELLWEGVKVDGRIYGIPVWKDTAATQYWMINDDFLKGADCEAEFKACDSTVASVTPLLEKIKAAHDANPDALPWPDGLSAAVNFNKSGLNGIDTGWDQLHGAIWVGVRMGDTTNTVKSFLDDEQFIADLKTLKDWADRGLSNADAMTMENEPKLLVVGSAQGWEGAEISAWGKDKPYTVSIQKKCGPYLTSGYIQGAVNCIGANSKHPKEALKYMEYINTNKEYRNMLAYGIQDVNWKLLDDGTVEYLTADDWAPGLFAQASWMEMYVPKGAPANMYKNICEMSNNAEGSPLIGFVPVTENVKTQATACASVITEYQNQLKTGHVDDVDATVAELLKKLEAAGYREVIAEYQKQADAFLAAKK